MILPTINVRNPAVQARPIPPPPDPDTPSGTTQDTAAIPAINGHSIWVISNVPDRAGLLYCTTSEAPNAIYSMPFGTGNFSGTALATVPSVPVGAGTSRVIAMFYDATTNSLVVWTNGNSSMQLYIYNVATWAAPTSVTVSTGQLFLDAVTVMNGFIYIITNNGGAAPTNILSDWQIGVASSWTNWSTSPTTIEGDGAGLAPDYVNNLLHVFTITNPGIIGGYNYQCDPRTRTTTLLIQHTAPGSSVYNHVAGGSVWAVIGTALPQLYSFSLSTLQWSSVAIGGGSPPSPAGAVSPVAYSAALGAFETVAFDQGTHFSQPLLLLPSGGGGWETTATFALVPGEIYVNAEPNSLYVYQAAVYQPTSSAAASLQWSLGISSPPSPLVANQVPMGGPAIQRLEGLLIPSGYYYSVSLTNASLVGPALWVAT